MDIDAYIFDMDGTLLDSESLWVEATEDELRDAGCPISHEEAVAIVYGRSWLDVYASIRARCPALGLSLPEMELALSRRMENLRESRDIRIPGSVDLLHRLAADYIVCVVSGSPRGDLQAAIDMLGIHAHLEFFLGAEDYGPGKPDPTCFLKAARMLSVAPEGCVVFEDSHAGITGAKAAGMTCVALARPGAPPQDVSGADLVLDDLADFDPVALTAHAR